MPRPMRRVGIIILGLLCTAALSLPAAAQSAPLSPEAYARRLAPTPPMGWNSWNHFASRINARIVREEADAMAAFMPLAMNTSTLTTLGRGSGRRTDRFSPTRNSPI